MSAESLPPIAPLYVVEEPAPDPLLLGEPTATPPNRRRYEWHVRRADDGAYSCCRSYYRANCAWVGREAHGHTEDELGRSIRQIHSELRTRREERRR